ncbi:oligosaccharide flippase family protein [Pontimicrobium sp. MEBiC06410]|jgi:O-antigen/teichoic acid export membrane protein
MGIVIKQSIKNILITYIGFAVGAINVLFLFTKFIDPVYYGLITFILSTANILMPLMAFGVNNTIVKFYSSFKTRKSQNGFLSLMLVLPLGVIIPFALFTFFNLEKISVFIAQENVKVKEYTWYIFLTAIVFAYFEVFYAWSKVQLKSVFGNFMKEVFHRICITLLLISLYYKLLTVHVLIESIIVVYSIRMLIMMFYAFSLKPPVFKFVKLSLFIPILKYTSLIIIAGSVANIILEIDKFMIGQYVAIENVAYYGVAIYIATVIGVPSRSMHQITHPLTAKLLNENNKVDLKILYKKSSLNLLIISGFIFLIVILNVNQLYNLLPNEYAGGFIVVLAIGLVKLFDNMLGNNNSILFNSDYYRVILLLGIVLAVCTALLNIAFIPKFGINGAAYATCIAIFIYNTIKVLFVYAKFKMLPFSLNTLKALILILICGFGFYFWEFQFHPILNIVLKSLLISLFYGVIVYRFNFSEDISILINKLLKR